MWLLLAAIVVVGAVFVAVGSMRAQVKGREAAGCRCHACQPCCHSCRCDAA